MEYLADIRRYYQLHQLSAPSGCSPAEIAQLEQQVGFPLPDAYKSYLAWMGCDYSGPLRGTNCFIDQVLDNTAYLPQLLAENGVEFVLPERYLAFYCHQGYWIAWFKLPKEDEDPPCYCFGEGSTEGVDTTLGRFSTFIARETLGMIACCMSQRRARPWWRFW